MDRKSNEDRKSVRMEKSIYHSKTVSVSHRFNTSAIIMTVFSN